MAPRTLWAHLLRAPDPHELALGLGGLRRQHRRLSVRERDPGIALNLEGVPGPGRHRCCDSRPVLDRRADRGTQDRRDGRHLPPAVRAAWLRRAGRPHCRHPRLVQPAQHADPGERARVLHGLMPGPSDGDADHPRWLRAADGEAGLGRRPAAGDVRAPGPPGVPVGGVGMAGLFDLSGRVALVTGSSRGLGHALAEGLA